MSFHRITFDSIGIGLFDFVGISDSDNYVSTLVDEDGDIEGKHNDLRLLTFLKRCI